MTYGEPPEVVRRVARNSERKGQLASRCSLLLAVPHRATSGGSPFPVPIPARVRRAAGFTLLEMLAVILLIGIAAAAVSVSVSQGLASARINAASSELVAAMRATRAQAIVKGHEQNFDVNLRQLTYQNIRHQDVALPKGLRLSMTSAKEDQPNDHVGRIRFFPDGSSTGGRVTLTSGKREWHVNVSWLTGDVRVVDSVAVR